MITTVTEETSARLAQSVEHETLNLRVVGSSPTLGGVKCSFCRNTTDNISTIDGDDDSMRERHEYVLRDDLFL